MMGNRSMLLARLVLALFVALTLPDAVLAQSTQKSSSKTSAPPATPGQTTPGPSTQNQPTQNQPAKGGDNSLAGTRSSGPLTVDAEDGLEMQQANKVYIARGNAVATRGGVTLHSDTIYAYYRDIAKPPAAPDAQPGAPPSAPPVTGNATAPPAAAAQPPKSSASGSNKSDDSSSGSTEIWRVVAEGKVTIETATQTIVGDRAVYDLDQALVVVTGNGLKLTTPQDVVTARDSLEWYDGQQVAVARGDAVAIRLDRRLKGDVLTAQVVQPPGQGSHISRVDGKGHVLISNQTSVGTGDTGVYNVDSGLATLAGNVKLTNERGILRGEYGVMDLNQNVSRLLPGPPGEAVAQAPQRVQGYFVPQQKGQAAGTPQKGQTPPTNPR
ncbi:MAG TPA: LptA/OstA family protein [Stellaceae bacterium]|nr:LptA/OstA family protein [Stellaceae bacterium]